LTRECRPASRTWSRARREFADGWFGASQRLCYLGKRHVEHVVQQKCGALERRQSFEREQQCERDVVGERGRGRRFVRALGDNRLRQPRTDVHFALGARRAQPIEAQARHDRPRERSFVFDACRIERGAPA